MANIPQPTYSYLFFSNAERPWYKRWKFAQLGHVKLICKQPEFHCVFDPRSSHMNMESLNLLDARTKKFIAALDKNEYTELTPHHYPSFQVIKIDNVQWGNLQLPRRHILRILTCTSLIGYIIGIKKCILTPHSLLKHLLKHAIRQNCGAYLVDITKCRGFK